MVGPTASAKSEVAFEVARRTGAEIISVDSMQVYRGLDIGTAKASAAMRAQVPHHMLDVAEPEDEFTVADFQRLARALILTGRQFLMVGGSGLHFRAVVDPLTFEPSDPAVRRLLEEEEPEVLVERLLLLDSGAGLQVDLANNRRVMRALEVLELTGRTPTERAQSAERLAVDAYEPLFPVKAVGIDPGEDLAARAAARVEAMWDKGLSDEVARVRPRLGRTAAGAIGYRETFPFLDGTADAFEVKTTIASNTVALAKRQRTYFRRDPRVRWLEWSNDPANLISTVMREFSP